MVQFILYYKGRAGGLANDCAVSEGDGWGSDRRGRSLGGGRTDGMQRRGHIGLF